MSGQKFWTGPAVMAGYSQVTGDYIITMDDDGQSPVDATFEILNKLKNENFDVVFGISTEVQFNTFRRFGSKVNGMMAKADVYKRQPLHIIQKNKAEKKSNIKSTIIIYNFLYCSNLFFIF